MLDNPTLPMPRALIVSPAVYPRLVVNYDFIRLNLESQNQTKDIPVFFPSSPIKIWGISVQEFRSYDRTNKQTVRYTTTLYVFRCRGKISNNLDFFLFVSHVFKSPTMCLVGNGDSFWITLTIPLILGRKSSHKNNKSFSGSFII